MKSGKAVLPNKYSKRYKNHEFLSEDILDKTTEEKFFLGIRTRLRAARNELKLTQREMGESAGIDRRYVAKVECGSQNPSFKFLRSLSIKHKLSLDWLLYEIGEQFVKTQKENHISELSLFKKFLDTATREDIEMILSMINKIR